MDLISPGAILKECNTGGYQSGVLAYVSFVYNFDRQSKRFLRRSWYDGKDLQHIRD